MKLIAVVTRVFVERQTAATRLVDELEPFRDAVVSGGGDVLVPPQPVPTGRNMVLRHPDGALFEYVALARSGA